MKYDNSQQLPQAFLLGLQVEELYSIFGESLFQVFTFASKEYMDSFYHKLEMINQCMQDLNLGNEFVSLSSFIREQVPVMSSFKSTDIAAIRVQFDISRSVSTSLDHFMNNVAAKLGTVDKLRFDMGIFIARISLCCRVIKSDDQARQQVYSKELERIKVHYLDALRKGKENALIEASFPGKVRLRLDSIAFEMENGNLLQDPRCVGSIHTQVEILLDDMGFSTKSAN